MRTPVRVRRSIPLTSLEMRQEFWRHGACCDTATMNTSRAAERLPQVPGKDVGSRRKPAETPRRDAEHAPEETAKDALELDVYNMPCTD